MDLYTSERGINPEGSETNAAKVLQEEEWIKGCLWDTNGGYSGAYRCPESIGLTPHCPEVNVKLIVSPRGAGGDLVGARWWLRVKQHRGGAEGGNRNPSVGLSRLG